MDASEKRQYRKRKANEEEDVSPTDAMRQRSRSVSRGGDRGSKGLRHFSRQVCDKVQQRGVTTYNEVADDLVSDFIAQSNEDTGASGDHKNIRRRVYDALNVLMAMRIIAKEKKEIKWLGLPSDVEDETSRLERLKTEAEQRVVRKQAVLQELAAQHTSLVNLMERNKLPMYATAEPRIQIPFIIVHTGLETVIDCMMTEDRTDIRFDFSQPFEIHDDNEILRRMELNAPADMSVQAVPAEVQALLSAAASSEAYQPGTPLSVQAEQGPVVAGNVTISTTPRRSTPVPHSPLRSVQLPGTPPRTPQNTVSAASFLMSPFGAVTPTVKPSPMPQSPALSTPNICARRLALGMPESPMPAGANSTL